jgi:hypothetical protein
VDLRIRGLVYDISVDDGLLAGRFKPNETPLLRFFEANAARTGVNAVNAVDFTSALWTENPNAIAAAAVNSTNTAAGALGAAGVLATAGATTSGGTTLLPEIFAEAAVGLAAFVNGNASRST